MTRFRLAVALAVLLAASCRTTQMPGPVERAQSVSDLTLQLLSVSGGSATLRLENHSGAPFAYHDRPAAPATVYESSLGATWVYYVISGCTQGVRDQMLMPGKSVEFTTELPALKNAQHARIRVGVQRADGKFIVWSTTPK